ncbi:MAG TPA: phosphoribosylanthranilate isomerase, partial [candidate division Zixibacteria bacterium]|nr:phosphoribosylanthranilate isomerase [candidate division Zixibacteria bacterium]
MNHFRIKVCGITRLQDALLADQLGADMVGFVFYKKSPRYMTIKKAKRIISKLPPTLDKVGVFIEPKLESILRTVRMLKLDYAQIHSNKPVPLIARLKKQGVKVIESFHITKHSDYERVSKSEADIFQFDNRTKGPGGGTGKRFD